MNDFSSENNDRVVNIAVNNAPVHIGGKDTVEKQSSNHYPLSLIVILALVVVVPISGFFILAFLQKSIEPNVQNSNVTSTINAQPNIMPQNANVFASNANQIGVKPNIDRPNSVQSKPNKENLSSNTTTKKVRATPGKIVTTQKTNKKGSPPCAYTSDPSDGC